MTKFYVEVTEDDKYFRIVEVETQTAREAFRLVNEKLDEDEYIYQICKDFPDVELPQPVYDFFNGFKLYEEMYE